MGIQVSFRCGVPNIASLSLTADEGVKGIVGQGRMGVSGLGVFIAAARGVQGVAGGVRGGDKGGKGGQAEEGTAGTRRHWHSLHRSNLDLAFGRYF